MRRHAVLESSLWSSAYARCVIPLEVELSDEKVSVRPFDPADRDALMRGRDDEFRRFLGTGPAEPAPANCIWSGGDLVGWIDMDDDRPWLHRREVNIGYSVFAEHRGRGCASRALRLVCDFLRSQDPPIGPSLLIDPDNAASLAVASRIGFEHVGTVERQRLFRPTTSRTELDTEHAHMRGVRRSARSATRPA